MSSTTKVIIIAFVLVAVLGISSFAVFLAYSPVPFGTITSPRSITITSFTLFIVYPNYPTQNTGYFGASYQTLCCAPIYLQPGETHQAQFVLRLAANETSHSVDQLSLGFSGSFNILSTSPNPPFTVPPGTSPIITVTLQAPNTNYDGPVTIDLTTH